MTPDEFMRQRVQKQAELDDLTMRMRRQLFENLVPNLPVPPPPLPASISGQNDISRVVEGLRKFALNAPEPTQWPRWVLDESLPDGKILVSYLNREGNRVEVDAAQAEVKGYIFPGAPLHLVAGNLNITNLMPEVRHGKWQEQEQEVIKLDFPKEISGTFKFEHSEGPGLLEFFERMIARQFQVPKTAEQKVADLIAADPTVIELADDFRPGATDIEIEG